MFLQQPVSNQGEPNMDDRIVAAVLDHKVEGGRQWIALSNEFPGISYFATDLDPRSFEYDEISGTWLGRAELLLQAPEEVRPGLFRDVSFTRPVRVVLCESGGDLSIEAFDYCWMDENESA